MLGLSVQDSPYQTELRARLHLPFHILSDADRALDLPTLKAAGTTLLVRMTLVLKEGSIEKVFFPVAEPEENAGDVLDYLRSL